MSISLWPTELEWVCGYMKQRQQNNSWDPFKGCGNPTWFQWGWGGKNNLKSPIKLLTPLSHPQFVYTQWTGMTEALSRALHRYFPPTYAVPKQKCLKACPSCTSPTVQITCWEALFWPSNFVYIFSCCVLFSACLCCNLIYQPFSPKGKK